MLDLKLKQNGIRYINPCSKFGHWSDLSFRMGDQFNKWDSEIVGICPFQGQIYYDFYWCYQYFHAIFSDSIQMLSVFSKGYI